MKWALVLTESARIALSAIFANRVRGALTALGIIIGIVAVVTTMTAANGLQNTFRKSFSSVGADVFYVSREPWVQQGNSFQFRNRERMEMDDADALQQRIAGYGVVNPTINLARPVKVGSTTMSDVMVVGTTNRMSYVSDVSTDLGRFMSPFDVRFKNNVAVIGSNIREQLFAGTTPINKSIRIGRKDFRVIGVMEEQGSGGFLGGPNFDRQIYIPISTFEAAYGTTNNNVELAIKAPNQEALLDLEYRVIGEVRRIRGLRPNEPDNFAINKLDSLMGSYNSTMGVVVLIGLLITGISLFVGGVGVMNIMFVSVTERTREIGIRKAIGAPRRSILLQFLLESSFICMAGGVIGLLLSVIVISAIDYFLMPAGLSFPIVFIALLVALVTGVFSGLIPAMKAAKLDPIDALRYE
jgi:putative ABC transport system permease protein